MNPHDRDESAVIDLAVINPQGHQRPPRQQQDNSPTASPLSPGLDGFNSLSPISSGSGVGGPLGAPPTRPPKQPRGPKPGEKKDCPRHADGHAPNHLTTRDLGGRRVASLFYGSDVVLFDTIMAYRLGNPDKRVDDAIDHFGEHQGADAMANIIYETQAFDMVFKYPIPEHLRKVPDAPPVLGSNPALSDIEIDSTSSAARARKEERLEQQRQLEEQLKRQQEQEAARARDVEAAAAEPKDPKVLNEEKLERYRIKFKKALLKEGLMIEEEPSIEGEDMFMKVYTPFWRLCVEAQRLRYKIELSHIETSKERAAADAAANKAGSQGFFARHLWRLVQKADNISLPLRPESLLFKASKLRQYSLAEKQRKWSDIVRHGGGIKPNGSGVGAMMGSDGKDGFFGTARRGNLTESIIIYSKIHSKRGDRQALKSVMDKKAFTDMYTLHDGSYKSKVQPIPNRRTQLYHSWVRSRRTQPLEEIRFYYGEKIALYFAWVGHYTKWLVSAAIAGLLFLIFGLINYFSARSDDAPKDVSLELVSIFDNALSLPYALFMSIWAALFVEYWKRKSNVLAYEWNTFDFERRERARPEFRPTGVRISPVTGKKELYYPRYKQVLSVLMSIMVVLVSIAIVIVSVGSLVIFNLFLRRDKNIQMNSYTVSVITAVLNLIVIMALGTVSYSMTCSAKLYKHLIEIIDIFILMSKVYARIAKLMTDNENHRRMTQYQDALIMKRFLFDFVNFYSTMVYIAFFKDNLGHKVFSDERFWDSCPPNSSCMGELTIQLAIVFVGKQFLNQAQEIMIPQFKKWWNKKDELAEKAANLKGKYKDKVTNSENVSKKPPQWAKDDMLPTYDPQMFEEYRELVIQFGFCTLFVIAFPIAPIFALLNNVLEIRVDAYKLLTQHRRPTAQGAQDIGSWETILMLMTHIAVFTNACLIAFQSKWMEKNVFTQVGWVQDWQKANPLMDINFALLAVRLLFIFIFEIAIANLVRDTPRTVKLAIERENYFTRLALDDEEPAMDEVLEDMDDDSDESDDDDDYRKRLTTFGMDDTWTHHDEKNNDGRTSRLSGEGGDNGDEDNEDDAEDDEELEALIKAGGCGCAAHGDGLVGTAKGGFEGTWMSRFQPQTQAALRRRQQRQRRKQSAKHE
ncbi:Anoctamin-7 [Mortierella alpina]|nr:Anoctamin-7 [Mortierella alpina]